MLVNLCDIIFDKCIGKAQDEDIKKRGIFFRKIYYSKDRVFHDSTGAAIKYMGCHNGG